MGKVRKANNVGSSNRYIVGKKTVWEQCWALEKARDVDLDLRGTEAAEPADSPSPVCRQHSERQRGVYELFSHAARLWTEILVFTYRRSRVFMKDSHCYVCGWTVNNRLSTRDNYK